MKTDTAVKKEVLLSAESPPGRPAGARDCTGQGNIAGALCHLWISTHDLGLLRSFEILNYFYKNLLLFSRLILPKKKNNTHKINITGQNS